MEPGAKHNSGRTIWGILLVAAGALLLLQNFEILRGATELLWGAAFAAAGIVFLATFASNRSHWWPLIPGCSLLGIGALIAISTVAPDAGGRWGGSFFLLMVALPFWFIFANQPQRWWPVIPGGTLVTLALVAALSPSSGELGGAIFFFGLAATFGLLYLLPSPGRRAGWALIPALVLLVLGLLVLGSSFAFSYLWPVVLIVAGLWLVYRTRRAHGGALLPATRSQIETIDPKAGSGTSTPSAT